MEDYKHRTKLIFFRLTLIQFSEIFFIQTKGKIIKCLLYFNILNLLTFI